MRQFCTLLSGVPLKRLLNNPVPLCLHPIGSSKLKWPSTLPVLAHVAPKLRCNNASHHCCVQLLIGRVYRLQFRNTNRLWKSFS
jgi:hypothetical protein